MTDREYRLRARIDQLTDERDRILNDLQNLRAKDNARQRWANRIELALRTSDRAIIRQLERAQAHRTVMEYENARLRRLLAKHDRRFQARMAD